eukprot:scaffold107916_cov25-Prasinocladus_malaysianus.AAC.2
MLLDKIRSFNFNLNRQGARPTGAHWPSCLYSHSPFAFTECKRVGKSAVVLGAQQLAMIGF